MQRLMNFIDGRMVEPRTGRWLDVTEPATGKVYAQAPDSDARDINDAVAAAKKAFPAWSAKSAAERARVLMNLADLIDRDADRLARAESIDNGKPITLARRLDIPRAASNFRFFAEAMQRVHAETYKTEPGAGAAGPEERALNTVLRKPRGVAGLISPWNLPLYLLTWKIAPAIVTGNTCVAKPSEVTPMTASLLAELCAEAGVPVGVINIVHGTGQGAGGELVKHPDVPTISFTGSTGVGRWISQNAGAMLKRVSLELGGKNAMIVLDDVDVAAAAAQACQAAFLNQGQICLCTSRILVHRRVQEAFTAKLVEFTNGMKQGDPLDESTQQGALVSKVQLDKVAGYVQMAKQEGAKIHCGGNVAGGNALPERCRGGYFHEPTVISGLDVKSRVEQEEVFGPVVTIRPFDDEDEAIALANGTPYGLAGVVLGTDAKRAERVASRMESGIVWVNCWLLRDLRTPFGGAKQSGVGREGGEEALKFFTEASNVCVREEVTRK